MEEHLDEKRNRLLWRTPNKNEIQMREEKNKRQRIKATAKTKKTFTREFRRRWNVFDKWNDLKDDDDYKMMDPNNLLTPNSLPKEGDSTIIQFQVKLKQIYPTAKVIENRENDVHEFS